MEPIVNCPGATCERHLSGRRLIRGMCEVHYKRWSLIVPKADRPKTRQVKVGCSVEDCEVQLIQGRGWCAKHYSRWKNHGDPQWEPPTRPTTCAADECGRENYALGYCVMHYNRLRVHGDPYANPRNVRSAVCDLDGCEKPSPGMPFCPMHRERLRRNGTFERQAPSRRHTHSMGYYLVKRSGHPTANGQGWAYEHRVILFDAIGPGWHPCHHCGMQVSWELTYPESVDALVVDHLDEDRANNHLENLVPSCNPCNFARSNRWVKQRRRAAS